MKWSICIITVPERKVEFERVYGLLQAQIGVRQDVELVICKDPSLNVGQKRQLCLESARGEYICFVDDDDLVPLDYIDTIYPLLDGVDYIGFQLQMYKDGAKQQMTTHSLKYSAWEGNEGTGWTRDISHLNPIKREIALRGIFDGTAGEDFEWANQVRGHVMSEHFINRPMYFYFYSMAHTLTRRPSDGNA